MNLVHFYCNNITNLFHIIYKKYLLILMLSFVPFKKPLINKALTIRHSNRMPITAVNPIPGIDIGIPLSLFQYVYTNLHYSETIIKPKMIVLQFLIGFFVYGKDRYYDALEYYDEPYTTTKSELYKYIYENKERINVLLDVSYTMTLYLMLNENDETLFIPFIMILYSTQWYKHLKPKLGPFKPVFISVLWTVCAVILPCVIHEHDYSIIAYPEDYLPCLLTIFSASNIIDNKDIIEDKKNGIYTLPVLLGVNNSNMISMITLIFSSILLGINHNYLNHPLINSFMEIQNAGISFLPFVLNTTLT